MTSLRRENRAWIASTFAAALAVLGSAYGSPRQTPGSSKEVPAARAPTIEFAIVEQVLDAAHDERLQEHGGKRYRAHEPRRFRFATASVSQDELGSPAVALVIDPRDAIHFEHWTRDNVDRLLAVSIDGRVVTVAPIQDALPGRVLVAPPEHWSKTEAEALAVRVHTAGTAAPRSAAGVSATAIPFALAPPYTPEAGSSVVIMLEKTACYGACPVYTIQIQADGSVWYLGEKHVGHVGERASAITSQAVHELLARFCAVDFLSATGRFGRLDVDSASMILTLSVNGRSKRIEFSGPGAFVDDGAEAVTRESLSALAKAIDSTVGSQRWVKR